MMSKILLALSILFFTSFFQGVSLACVNPPPGDLTDLKQPFSDVALWIPKDWVAEYSKDNQSLSVTSWADPKVFNTNILLTRPHWENQKAKALFHDYLKQQLEGMKKATVYTRVGKISFTPQEKKECVKKCDLYGNIEGHLKMGRVYFTPPKDKKIDWLHTPEIDSDFVEHFCLLQRGEGLPVLTHFTEFKTFEKEFTEKNWNIIHSLVLKAQ